MGKNKFKKVKNYYKMKTIETVYNKLNSDKTELGTHKVELSVLNDLKKGIEEAERIRNLQDDGFKFAKKAEQEFKEYLKTHTDAIGVINSSRKQVNKTQKLLENAMSEAEKISKELGVKPNSIKEYVNAIKIYNDIIDTNRDLFNIKDKLEKFKV